MTYRVLVNGSTPSESNRVIANIEATDVSALICWVGIIDNDNKCNPYSGEQTYCETVYVGENTSTSSTAYTGTIIWHGNTIWYTINQSGVPEQQECTTKTYCSGGTNVWISPYVVTKGEGGHDIKFYTEYSAITVTTCGGISAITNVEKITSSGCPITDSEGLSAKTEFEAALSSKTCSDTDRIISASCRLIDIVPCLSATTDSSTTVSATCYLQEDENCCDNSGTSICYKISDIVYSPSSVPFSGGDVYYSFDYKKLTTTNCVTSVKNGTYISSTPWHISGRTVGEQDECLRKQVTSSFTPSFADFMTCVDSASTITLNIWQGKNTTACTEETCDECLGYIIDGASIGQSAYTSNGTWERIGTSADTHTFPSYGGQLRVEWKYSAITRYDDCSYSVSSGNTWTDIKQISPSDECYNAGESDETDPISIEYVFKNGTAKCFPDIPALSADCNTFTIKYTQKKTPCVQDCPSCMGDGAITLDCGYSASTDAITKEVIYGDKISGVTAVSSKTNCNVISAITDTVCNWLLISKSGDYYVYSANTANSGSSRTCVVLFDLGKIGNVPCTETVTVTQLGSGAEQDPSDPEAPIVCPCKYADGLYFGVYSLGEIPYKGGSPLDVASYGYGECVSAFTLGMKEEVDWFTNTGITSAETEGEVEGALSGSVDCNCDCDHERTFELEYTYAASGCSGESGTTIITQSKNTNCNCNKITAMTASSIESSGGRDITIGTYKLSLDCPPTAATVESTTANFISNVRLSNTSPKLGNGNVIADVDCNYCNSSDRSGDISITYQIGNKTCTASFIATQKAGASATLTPSLISSTGGNVVTLATYSISGEQPDTITPSVSDESFIHDVGITSDNKISGTVDCNYCNSSSRTNVVSLKYKKGTCECEKTCIITQQGGSSITLSAGNDIPSTGGTVTLASYEISGSIPLHISASSNNNMINPIGVDETNKTVTGTVSSNYCNSTSRGATITLTYYNVQSCSCTRTCNVTQVAGTSAVLAPSDEIACIGGSNITLATYIITGDESPSVSVTSSDNTNFNITSYANGIIKGTVTENCCNESSRECTLTLTYSNGSSSCTKTCTITQKGSANDKQITCTDENYTPVSECPYIETTSGGTLYLKLTDI